MSWLHACTEDWLGYCCLRPLQSTGAQSKESYEQGQLQQQSLLENTNSTLFAARAALLACRFLRVCAFDDFVLCFLIAYACLTITSLCNTNAG